MSNLRNNKDPLTTFAGGALYSAGMAGGNFFSSEVNTTASMPGVNVVSKGVLEDVMQTDYLGIDFDFRPIKDDGMYVDDVDVNGPKLMAIYVTDARGRVTSSSFSYLGKESSEGINSDRLNSGTMTSSQVGTAAASTTVDSVTGQKMALGVVYGVIGVPMPNTIASLTVDMANGNYSSLESTAINGVLGMAATKTSAVVGAKAVAALGATGIAAIGVMAAVAYGFSALAEEIGEVVNGTDTSFGYGGQFIGTNQVTGEIGHTTPQNVVDGLVDQVKSMVDSSYMSYSEVDISNFEADTMAAELGFMNDFNLTNDQMNNLSSVASIGTNDPNAAYSGPNATLSDFMSDMDSNFAAAPSSSNTGAGDSEANSGNAGDPGGYGYGGDGGGNNSSGSSNNSSGGGGTWICTASRKEEIITSEMYTIVKKYGIQLRRTDPYMMKTYDVIGKKLAKLVKNKGISKILSTFMVSYFIAKYTNLPLTKSQQLFDILSVYILRPIYRFIGKRILK